MRSLHGFLTRAAAIGVLAACCAAPVGAAEDADTAGYVIPPGQEELLLTMLGRGASLPDGCSLTDGRVEYRTVKATYACPLGDVVIALSHPETGTDTSTATERFALIVDSGSPPNSLIDALAANVRKQEGSFEWVKIGEPEDADADGDTGEAPGDAR